MNPPEDCEFHWATPFVSCWLNDHVRGPAPPRILGHCENSRGSRSRARWSAWAAYFRRRRLSYRRGDLGRSNFVNRGFYRAGLILQSSYRDGSRQLPPVLPVIRGFGQPRAKSGMTTCDMKIQASARAPMWCGFNVGFSPALMGNSRILANCSRRRSSPGLGDTCGPSQCGVRRPSHSSSTLVHQLGGIR